MDGVHVPTVTFGRKTGGQRAFYAGKHKRHGLNVQTACSPAGELLWAAPAPGAAVDVTAARKAGIAAILTSPSGAVHRHGQGRPGPALHGTRPVRRPARRVTRRDRYPSGTLTLPAGPYSKVTRKMPGTSGKNPGRSCQIAAHPAGTQDERSSLPRRAGRLGLAR